MKKLVNSYSRHYERGYQLGGRSLTMFAHTIIASRKSSLRSPISPAPHPTTCLSSTHTTLLPKLLLSPTPSHTITIPHAPSSLTNLNFPSQHSLHVFVDWATCLPASFDEEPSITTASLFICSCTLNSKSLKRSELWLWLWLWTVNCDFLGSISL